MDLEGLSKILGGIGLSSLITSLFFWFLWILAYAFEKAMLMKVIGYISLLWLILAFGSGFLALICYIWSAVFEW